MLYTRNKDCFKKTTAKIEHNQARKNILNLVKQAVERDAFTKLPSCQNKQFNQNKSALNQFAKISSPIINFERKTLDSPIICQSIYESTRSRPKILTIEQVMNLKFVFSQNVSRVKEAHNQYVTLLQVKIKQLQAKLIQSEKNSKYEQTMKYDMEYQNLIRFYNKSRNIIIKQSTELLECKSILLKYPQYKQRIVLINQQIYRSEQFLQNYKRSYEVSKKPPSKQINLKIDIQELKRLCQYQQKTIKFLMQQKWKQLHFNEIKLLRYQINRVCAQNEQYIIKLNKTMEKSSPISPIKNKDNDELRQKQSILITQINDKINKIANLESQIAKLNESNKQMQNKIFKLTYEKECLGQILNIAKNNEQQLQKTVQECENAIKQLKMRNKIKLNEREGATTEQLFRELQPYPKYFKLLRTIITDYQYKISQLQDMVCLQRERKQQFLQWSKQVYNLLHTANIPQQILDKHTQHLYNIQNKSACSKIQKLLRQIWALSIGMDNLEMEVQLEQYVVSLKNRHQVIKEVDIEDGSSVGYSEHFTQQDFQ